jgi:iron(III) transport system permease protein
MIGAAARLPTTSGFRITLVVASTLLIGALVLYPVGRMLQGLFIVDGRLSLVAFTRTLSEPELPEVLLDTAIFVVLVVGLSLAIGAVLAWLAERTDASLGWASSVVPLVPLLLPSIAGTIGWVLLLAPRAGLLNVLIRKLAGSDALTGPVDIFSLPGMVAVAVMHSVPFAYLAVSSALRNLDASYEEASRTSGAGVFRTISRVSLPMVRPALMSATVLLLIASVGLFSVPAILGANADFTVISVFVYRLVNVRFPPEVDEAVALSMITLAVIQGVIVLQWVVTGRRYQTMGAQGLRRGRFSLGWLRWPARALVVAYLLVAGVLPLLALIFVSFERFWTPDITPAVFTLANLNQVFFADPSYVTALRNSVLMGLGVAVVDLGIAVMIAYYLSRSPGILARVLDLTATLPATIPHIVLGVAFLVAFSQPPVRLYGTVAILIVAYLGIYMPQAMQSARFAFGQLSPELAEASRVFGSSEGRTFFRILLPLILPTALAGGLIVAVLTVNETNASVLLTSVQTPVVGPTIYQQWNQGSVPSVAAFATVVCALNATIALSSVAIGRRFSSGRGP